MTRRRANVLTAFTKLLDGGSAAASTAQRKRAIFTTHTVQRTAPKTNEQMEPGFVINTWRAHTLLGALYALSARGRHLAAFFGSGSLSRSSRHPRRDSFPFRQTRSRIG